MQNVWGCGLLDKRKTVGVLSGKEGGLAPALSFHYLSSRMKPHSDLFCSRLEEEVLHLFNV
jgi:hypothetical protein